MPTTAPVTLRAVRVEVLHLTQPYPLVGGTPASGASTTTFTDALDLVDPLLGGVYVGGWLLRSNPTVLGNDRERRITAHNTATGVLTVAPAFTVAPAASEEYEVWSTDRPTLVERLVNRALWRVRAPIDTALVGVAGQRQYDLSEEAWLLRPSQVLGVYARAGQTGRTEDSPVEGWRIYQDGHTLVLDLRESTFGGGDTVVLRAMRDYGSGQGGLTTDEDSSTQAPLPLLAHEVAWDLCKRPPQGLDTSPDLLDQRKERAHQIKRELLAIRDAYRSTVSVPLFQTGESWGIGGYGHTPGARWA